MDFLDRSGHLFSLPSYNYEPIGHEFEENDYIFWIDSKKLDKLSVDNYYTRTIYIAIPFDTLDNESFDENVQIDITIDSNKFWLLSTNDIQSLINNGKSISEYFDYNINSESKLKKLSNEDPTNNDLLCIVFDEDKEIVNEDDKKHTWVKEKYAIIPIYVVCMSEIEGTWLTNILIHVFNKTDYNAVDEQWCSITVGGEFEEENEILTINGQNMGIQLPKTLFKSIYQCSFINNEFNEQIYNEKLKEYLMNYMNIVGERGNYNSAINSLKWFGYGDHITIYKLLNTDNEIKRQFLRDNFNIKYDLLESFKYFVNSTYITLSLKDNEETGEIEKQNISEHTFWGENTPKMIDNFDRYTEVKYDYNNEKYRYIKPYYDFTFYEMGLKLSCLKYYYKKYFLPIYLNIHASVIEHKVYANNIKMTNETYVEHISETPIMTFHEKEQVRFDHYLYKYFTHQIHYVDEHFNEWKETNINYLENDNKDYYEIDDICLNIPIVFINDTKLDNDGNKIEIPTYYNCVLLLERENDIYSSNFPYRLKLNYKINIFKDNLYIFEYKTKKQKNLDNYQWAFSIDNNTWSLWVKGYNKLVDNIKDSFKYKIYSENYDESLDNPSIEINSDKKITYKIICEKIIINDQSENLKNVINQEYITIEEKPQEFYENNYYVYIPSISELHTNVMNITDVYSYIICVPTIYLMCKYDDVEVHNIIVNYTSIKNKAEISFMNDTQIIYESHFSFIQNPDDLSSQYNSFVLYPPILGNNEITPYINKKFILKLLVNGRWYIYRFETKMPDIQLEFGKLEYNYYQNINNHFNSRFEQLLDITPDSVKFNSFMYEPKLVETNDINYFENIEQYIIKNNIKNISEDILSNISSKYIIVSYKNGNNIKILFNKDTLNNLNDDQQNNKKLYDLFDISEGILEHAIIHNPLNPTLYILNEELVFVKSVLNRNNQSDTESIWERVYFNNRSYSLHNHNSIYIDNIDLNDFSGIRIQCDSNKNIWVSYNNDNDQTLVKDYDAFFFINNEHKFLNNFIANKHTSNNRKYLNNIILFDIYEKKLYPRNEFTFNGNMNITCNGVAFKHNYKIPEYYDIIKNDKTIQIDKSSGIYISGMPIWDDNVFSNDIDYYTDFTNFDITTKDSNIYDNISKRYNIDNLESIYPDNPPITEANYIGEELDLDSFNYYWYEDVLGKYYYTLDPINLSKYENEYAYKFINKNTSTIWQSKSFNQAIENVFIGTIIFDTFAQIMSTNEELEYHDIIFASKNNYSNDNTIINKFVTNNQLKFKLTFTNILENKTYTFNDIRFKIKYVKQIGGMHENIYMDIDEETQLTYEERISMLQNIPCENVYIAIYLYNFAKVGEFFDTQDYTNYTRVGNNDLKLINEASTAIKRKIGTNSQIEKYIQNNYRYVLLSEFKNRQDNESLIPVLVQGNNKKLYVNYHNSYFPDENINYVSSNQPGQYIYDLTSVIENFEEDETNTHTLLDKITENDEYNKFVLNISNDENSLESYRNELNSHRNKENPYKNTVRFDDYEYSKENMYIIKRITKKVGIYNFDFYLEFLSDDINDGHHYSQEELKQFTHLVINYREYNNETSTYTDNISTVGYYDNGYEIELKQPDDIIDVIIELKLTDDPNNSLDLHSKNNRKYIPEFILYPIIQYIKISYEKLKYNIDNNESENNVDELYNNIYDAIVNDNQYLTNSKEVDLYNEFFEKKYVYRDSNNELYEIDNNELNSIYTVDRIYKIEQQYNIWSKQYTIESNNNIEDFESSDYYIFVKEKNNPIKIYSLKNSENEIQKISELNIVDYQNFIMFSKYLYSILFECDIYECKTFIRKYNEIQHSFDNIIYNEDEYEIWLHDFTIETIDDYDMNMKDYYIYIKDDNIIGKRYLLKHNERNRYLNLSELQNNESLNYIYKYFITYAYHKYLTEYNSNQQTTKTYNELFNEIIIDDYTYDDEYYTYISPNVNIETYLDYDVYLMHDLESWYVILISKETIDKIDDISKEKLLDGHMILKCKNSDFKSDKNDYKFKMDLENNIIGVYNDFFYNNTNYELRYVKSNNDMLINRMKFISSNGRNTFNRDDIIVGNIKINHTLPVNIMKGSKWHIKPMSYGMYDDYNIESNAKMTIIPYSNNSSTYQKGFYNVDVRYCIDKNTQHQYTNKAKLRIK